MSGSSRLADFAKALEDQGLANAGTLAMLKNGALTDTGSFFEPKPIVATSDGQTTFPVTYTVGPSLLVWGGSLLMEGYTASSGANLILTDGSGVKAGDKGWLITLTPFAVANAVSLTGTAYDAARLGGLVAAAFAKVTELAALALLVRKAYVVFSLSGTTITVNRNVGGIVTGVTRTGTGTYDFVISTQPDAFYPVNGLTSNTTGIGGTVESRIVNKTTTGFRLETFNSAGAYTDISQQFVVEVG